MCTSAPYSVAISGVISSDIGYRDIFVAQEVVGQLACHLRQMDKIVENHRTYGSAPYTVAVVHGGPGAAGEMAPVARAGHSGAAPNGNVLGRSGRGVARDSDVLHSAPRGVDWFLVGRLAELHRRGAVSRTRPQTAPRREWPL